MPGTLPVNLNKLFRWFTVLALLVGSTGAAFARTQAPASAANPPAYLDIVHDVKALQTLLEALGYYRAEQGPSGQWDEATAAALGAFQADLGLPVTEALDDLTLHALGGPVERMNDRPRFYYTLSEGESLADVARRFGSKVAWLLRFNPGLLTADPVAAGSEIVVPVDIPLPEGFQADRVQVLAGRFLGTYRSGVPFASVSKLADQMTHLLQERGFEVEAAATPLDGITLRGNGVVLGRVVFSAVPADGNTQVHLALLFRNHAQYEQEFKEGLEGGAWIGGQGEEEGGAGQDDGADP